MSEQSEALAIAVIEHLGPAALTHGKMSILQAFEKGWQAALSQPAPQGVEEVMELVDELSSTRFVEGIDGDDTATERARALVEQALATIVQERDALRARKAEMERDAAHARHIRAAGFALSNIAFNLKQREGGILTAAECKTLVECQANWDAAIAASKEAPL